MFEVDKSVTIKYSFNEVIWLSLNNDLVICKDSPDYPIYL